jgi:hypothetical protein
MVYSIDVSVPQISFDTSIATHTYNDLNIRFVSYDSIKNMVFGLCIPKVYIYQMKDDL